MGKLIGVQFQKNGKLYYFDANGYDVKPGYYVIVDTARGHDLGEVAMGPREIDEETWKNPLKKTIRIATEQDVQHGIDNREKEKEAFSVCQKKIAEHKLEMKLVSVEYAFDNSKILFFFTANGRVDFRSLVKDLASVFKMRIELRQIGVRDEAKMLGGLGPCGRPICCGTFLDQFQPVSIKMAKEQNLSMNPTKISGVCGRLMCCLKYEQEHYEMTRKKMPKVGREVITPDGSGTVSDLNIVKETVFVRMMNGDTSEIKEYPLEDISRLQENSLHQDQDSGRKNGPVENRPDPDGEQTPEIKSEDDEFPYSDSIRYDSDPSDQKDDRPAAKGKENNRNRHKKAALGKPVKRENPNRKDQSSAPIPDQTQKETKQQDPSPASSSASKNNWADALEKAIQAIGQDK